MTNATGAETVGQLGEFGLIARIAAALAGYDPAPNDPVLIGPGDDAAQIAVTSGSIVVSSDLLVEHRHFRRDWSSARDIGRKAAACNMSDINAMGGRATALTVGFGAPGELPVAWVDEFVEGFVAECAKVGAHLVGGDVTASDAIVIAVTAIGETLRPVQRSGARPGDQVAFAGTLGLAGAGFAALGRGFRSPREAVDAHSTPQPPYTAGAQAAEAGATAMIDISDGLLADLGHIAAESRVAVDIESAALPIPDAVRHVADALGQDPLRFVLTGGDDYALAGTFGSEVELPQGWTRIGSVAEGNGVTVDHTPWDGEAGHEHYR